MKENEVLIKTPEEAIETIKSNMPTSGYQMLRESLDMAVSALKEIQQYREIGTVEECREAVEKQKPEKPEIYTDTIQTISSSFNRDVYLCSRCGQFIGNIDDELPRYCDCCGQRIDENLEEMEDEG